MNSDPFAPSKKLLGYKPTTIQERIEKQDRIDYVEIKIEECRQLPFLCDRLIHEDKCCITGLAGLPKHPDTLNELPLTPYQLQFKALADANPKSKFHVNKPRQSGFSEGVLRIFQERAFKQYATKSIKYVVGTREKTTKKMIRRLKDLYKRIPDVIENNGDSLYLELKDGTNYEGLPASAEAVTGDTKIAAVGMDEAPKWNKIDDTDVLNSYIPIIRTNKADLFMFGTPKGPRGFFYNLDEGKDQDNDYIKYRYNIWATEGNLYTKQEIESMLADKSMDSQQEFMNQYTAGNDSVFGSINEDIMEEENIDEWR